jgi:hypothetical protein
MISSFLREELDALNIPVCPCWKSVRPLHNGAAPSARADALMGPDTAAAQLLPGRRHAPCVQVRPPQATRQ